MTDKKIYKMLSVGSFIFTAVMSIWVDPFQTVIGFLIALYTTLWAILAHLEEKQ